MAAADELAEFQALSAKVSAKTASEAERVRWRQLRAELAAAPPAPLPHQQLRTPKKLKVELAPLHALHATFTEEVSAGGLTLRVPAHVESGTVMVLRLELGEPGPLTLSARVAWCKRDGGHFLAGLEFVDLRDDERQRIEAWSLSAPPTRART